MIKCCCLESLFYLKKNKLINVDFRKKVISVLIVSGVLKMLFI